MKASGSLEVREARLAYPEVEALRGVTLSLSPGSFLGLLGPNGAGKSTLLRAMGGLARLSSGQVSLDGKPLESYSRRELARQVALVPQATPFTFPFLAEEVVMMGRYPYLQGLGLEEDRHREVVERCMRFTGTWELRRRRVHQLSGGESQRVRIAQALAQDTAILLLDEPTAHLDLAHQVELLELLGRLNQENRLTVVLSIHDLNLAAGFCDRLAMLRAGALVVEGEPGEVLTPERVSEVYGLEVNVELVQGLPRVFPRRKVFKSC